MSVGLTLSPLKLGERGRNFQNTGDIEMSVYLFDTGNNNNTNNDNSISNTIKHIRNKFKHINMNNDNNINN